MSLKNCAVRVWEGKRSVLMTQESIAKRAGSDFVLGAGSFGELSFQQRHYVWIAKHGSQVSTVQEVAPGESALNG
jgi:hypothetical protein